MNVRNNVRLCVHYWNHHCKHNLWKPSWVYQYLRLDGRVTHLICFSFSVCPVDSQNDSYFLMWQLGIRLPHKHSTDSSFSWLDPRKYENIPSNFPSFTNLHTSNGLVPQPQWLNGSAFSKCMPKYDLYCSQVDETGHCIIESENYEKVRIWMNLSSGNARSNKNEWQDIHSCMKKIRNTLHFLTFSLVP